jgi:hypothetical protein
MEENFMEYDFKEVLDIGLEIEFSNIKRETPSFQDSLHRYLSNFKHVHDASTETPEITLGNIPLQFEVNGKTNKLLSIVKNRSFEVLGGELNSPVLSGLEFREHIYKLIDFLIVMGESFSTTEQDTRGSIHVHVNVSKDIKHKHLLRLLEVGLATEAIFFRLGGMGRVNRGVKNDFIYQRPLTMPPCIKCDNRYYPIFDYKDLLESKNKTDFYNKYGDTVYQIHNGNHYATQRYMGLNFYSIPFRGSIEFRYANKVLIPEWIISWIILCQSFVNFALTKTKDETFENEYRKLEDNRNIPENEFLFILDKLGVPDNYKITLLDIWNESPTPEFNGKHIITHLPNYSFFSSGCNYLPTPIDNAIRSNIIDVRIVNSEKSSKLSAIRNSYPDLDYVIDTNGVKSKLKEIGIYEDNNNPNIDPITRNWLIAGLDLLNHNDDIDNVWIQSRIIRGKIIPFSILRHNFMYEYVTKYDDIHICFKSFDNMRKVEFIFYDMESGNESRPIRLDTRNSDTFGCRGFDFTDYIENVHQCPEDYFPQNDEEEELFVNEDEIHNLEEQIAQIGNAGNIVEDAMNNINNAVNNVANNIPRIRRIGDAWEEVIQLDGTNNR